MRWEQHGEAGVGTPLSAPTDPACSSGFPRGEEATALASKTHLMLWGWWPMPGSWVV